MAAKSKPTIKVNGVDLKVDSLYTIIHKPDSSAPKAYKEEGVSKTPHPYIADFISCVYKNNRWDTGFYEQSECYRGMNPAERKVIVKDIQEKLVKPLEALYGEGALDHNNNDFWDNWGFEVRQDKPIDTSDPEQLLGVYMGLLHGKLAYEDEMKASRFNGAMFALSNRSEKVNRQEENRLQKSLVIANALSLFDTNKDMLFKILSYVGLNVQEDIDKLGLNTIIDSWINTQGKGITRARNFNDTVKMADTVKGKKILSAHKELKDLYNKGIVVREGGVLKANGVELGNNFKEAASNVVKDKKLDTLIVQLLEV
jgi:hypothetical protein